jgi:hypothetical protein
MTGEAEIKQASFPFFFVEESVPRLCHFCEPLHEISLTLIWEPGYRWQQMYGRYSKSVPLSHSRVASCPHHFLQEQSNLYEMYQGMPQQCKAVV